MIVIIKEDEAKVKKVLLEIVRVPLEAENFSDHEDEYYRSDEDDENYEKRNQRRINEKDRDERVEHKHHDRRKHDKRLKRKSSSIESGAYESAADSEDKMSEEDKRHHHHHHHHRHSHKKHKNKHRIQEEHRGDTPVRLSEFLKHGSSSSDE